MIEEYSKEFFQKLWEVGPKLLLAIITLFVGLRIIKFIGNYFRKALEQKSDEQALNIFLTKLFSIVLKVALIISVISMIGVDTTSFIAMLGAAGLAVGLALQGSLANFAGGILILLFKPFRIDEFIEAQGLMGTVERIDILHTVLRTPDNKTVVMPNGQLANSPLTNFSRKEMRRVEYKIGISYGSDIKKAREIVLRILRADERVLEDPEPMVVLTELGDSSLNLSARAWVKTPDFWKTYWDNLEEVKESFDREGIEIPFPQRDVHLFEHKAKS